MARKRYFLFQYAPRHSRIGVGATVHEACKDAFGVVYGPTNNVKYKDLGTRSPAYIPQKKMQVFYGEEGWLNIP